MVQNLGPSLIFGLLLNPPGGRRVHVGQPDSLPELVHYWDVKAPTFRTYTETASSADVTPQVNMIILHVNNTVANVSKKLDSKLRVDNIII